MGSSSSSDPMDDSSFRDRVQKVFGSLSSSSQSPWSLTGDEVEKREWARGRAAPTRDDDATPCSSSFDGLLFPKDRKKSNSRRGRRQLDDDDDLSDDGDGEKSGGGDDDGGDREEWEARSSIGMDSTLDNEEEEDEYDRVAEGRENASDILYMRDVTDHGPFLHSYNVLPSSVYETPRDLRANHLAAITRLKEDEVDAHIVGSNHTCEKSMSNVEEPPIKTSEHGGKPKSILKRKHAAATSKEQKRVKFDSGCKDDCQEASENRNDLLTGTPSMQTTVSDDNSLLARNTLGVPDYLLNPSKYTRYSFDSTSEVDDKLNSQVCMDFLNVVKPPKPEESSSLKVVKTSEPEESSSLLGDASSSHLPTPITFIPRKKDTGARPRDSSSSEVKQNHEDGSKQPLIRTGFTLAVADGETQGSEVDVMEDEVETNTADTSTGFQKPHRQYRTRSKLDDPAT